MAALDGWRVLIPRPDGRASALIALLEAQGAVPQAVPLISIAPPADSGALDAAVLALAAGDYTWVGFTSVNAVTAVSGRAAALAVSPALPADTRVAAVGPATAAALRSLGWPVDLMGEHAGSAAGLASIWPAGRTGESVLLPQSEIAGPVLSNALRERGYVVDTVAAYRTLVDPLPDDVAADLRTGAFTAVLLTSASTVRAVSAAHIAPNTVLAAIGASTAAAGAAAGLRISLVAPEPTDVALVAGLTAFATTRAGSRR